MNDNKTKKLAENSMRSSLAWFLPFLVAGGMAIGALFGISLFGYLIEQEEAAGDLAGAAGALILLICVFTGFITALITIIVAKVMKYKSYNHYVFRICISFAGGLTIGSILKPNDNSMLGMLAWLLLVAIPIIASWPWKVKKTL